MSQYSIDRLADAIAAYPIERDTSRLDAGDALGIARIAEAFLRGEAALTPDLSRIREVLEFYADPETWGSRPSSRARALLAELSATPAADGWVEWKGGDKAPVKGEVEIRLRNGVVRKATAVRLHWFHGTTPTGSRDIVAYRPPSAAPAPEAAAPVQDGEVERLAMGLADAVNTGWMHLPEDNRGALLHRGHFRSMARKALAARPAPAGDIEHAAVTLQGFVPSISLSYARDAVRAIIAPASPGKPELDAAVAEAAKDWIEVRNNGYYNPSNKRRETLAAELLHDALTRALAAEGSAP